MQAECDPDEQRLIAGWQEGQKSWTVASSMHTCKESIHGYHAHLEHDTLPAQRMRILAFVNDRLHVVGLVGRSQVSRIDAVPWQVEI